MLSVVKVRAALPDKWAKVIREAYHRGLSKEDREKFPIAPFYLALIDQVEHRDRTGSTAHWDQWRLQWGLPEELYSAMLTAMK